MEEIKDTESQKPSEPHISVFGEEVGSKKSRFEEGQKRWEARKECWDNKRQEREYYRRRDSGSGIGGLMFLLAGIILLLNSLGVVPWHFWDFVWRFWPALLVLVGIHVILGHSWFSRFITFLLALGVFAFVILYGLIHVSSPLVKDLPQNIQNFVNNFNQGNIWH